MEKRRRMGKVSSLAVFYGVNKAISEIYFEVFQGEMVDIMGANGAEKSTVLKAGWVFLRHWPR